jgi:hypothetical protein
MPTISSCQVIRDGVINVLPTLFLVSGDVIYLNAGERAPCLIQDPVTGQEWARGTLMMHSEPLLVMTAPLKHVLEDLGAAKKPRNIFQHQLLQMKQFLLSQILPVVIGIMLLTNILRIIFQSSFQTATMILDGILVLPIFACLPLLPLTLPTFLVFNRTYGNAKLLTLLEGLQNSKTEYLDKDDVDEFDAAPAPTKSIATDWGKILFYMKEQVFFSERILYDRSLEIVENLASITVICFVDQQGTLAETYPNLQNVVLLDERAETITLEVLEDKETGLVRFEESEWLKYSKYY